MALLLSSSQAQLDYIEHLCYDQTVKGKRTRHTVHNMTYHLVWCPKYRHRVLTNPVAERLDQLLRSKVTELEGEIVALEIQQDHVHLFAKFPPILAVCQIMHHLKGYTSYTLRREFPWLKQRLPSLWTRSYYVGTAGEVSAETIRRYIEAQRGCREQRE